MIKTSDHCDTFECVLLPHVATDGIADLQEISEHNRILRWSDRPRYEVDYEKQNDSELPLVS